MSWQHWISHHGSAAPQLALALFVGISALVVIYIALDRRGAHHERMARLALDEERDHG